MNELRKNYKTFEDALNDYIASFMEAERDFGCYAPPTEKERERLAEQLKSLWNAETCSLDAMEFRYY